jgi:hypothetical protein
MHKGGNKSQAQDAMGSMQGKARPRLMWGLFLILVMINHVRCRGYGYLPKVLHVVVHSWQ